MILHTQPQDGDLFPDEAIFTAKAVRPVPLPPSPAPSSSETLTAALRTALAEILPAPTPAAADAPPARRRAAERNFRCSGDPDTARSGFRPSFGLRKAVAGPAAGRFSAGSGTCGVRAVARDAVPIIMAGLGAVAGLPEEKKRVAGRLTTFIGSAVAVLMASAALVSFRTAPAPAVARVQEATPVEAAYESGLQGMAATVRAFFDAATPEEKVRTIRGGSAMLSVLHDWYAVHPDEAPGFHMQDVVNLPDGRGFVMVRGVNDSGQPVQALLQESRGGGWLMDWRSCTGAGDMAWEQWLEQRPDKPVTQRAVAVLDKIYAAPFDEQHHLCLKITDASDTAGAWAYVERSSPAGQELTALLAPQGQPVRMRLRFTGVFTFPPGPHTSAAARVQLLSLTSKTWRDDTPEAAALLAAAHTTPRP